MIKVREPNSIYRIQGDIKGGIFNGRWHFSFDEYHDSKFMQFGNLRVFNDDTLSPGAVWPLHPHYNIEVVTYCADGEFRHEDEHGEGGVLKKGWVQHTTVGQGLWHSEINERTDVPMRFVQMWFLPSERNLKPSVEQRQVEKSERTNKLLLLISNKNSEGLKIFSDAEVYSCFLQKEKAVKYKLDAGRGVYFYVAEGGPVMLNGNNIEELGAALVTSEKELTLKAAKDAELLLVDTAM